MKSATIVIIFFCLLLILLPGSIIADIHEQPSDGALKGKTVYISPGHGYYWHSGYSQWLTQRNLVYNSGSSLGIVEDFSNAQLAIKYLIPMLTNAGARVICVRERSFQQEEIIININSNSPDYVETGNWSISTSTGWAGNNYHYVFANSTAESATASFSPNFRKAGFYPVYIWFRPGTNRSDKVNLRVNHSGGTTECRINQLENAGRADFAGTWNFIGNFYFEKGRSGSVVISDFITGSSGSEAIIADAVKFGGGMGSINRGSGTSQMPRWSECSRYWAQFCGAPTSVFDISGYSDHSDDITCRPKFANWLSNDGAGNVPGLNINSIYLSLHSNGFNGSTRGTETYMMNNASGTPRFQADNQALRNSVHDNFIATMRNSWDSAWTDRGKKTGNYGELRIQRNTIPSCLIETAFHDNPADCACLRNENWRELAARGITKGIIRYFAKNSNATVIPVKPKNLMVRNIGSNKLRISWRKNGDTAEPGKADATGFKVYVSENGYGFDEGNYVAASGISNSYDFTGTPGKTYFFKVSQVNSTGESLTSETLGARIVPVGTAAPAIIVNGFDRTVEYVVNDNGTVGRIRNKYELRDNPNTFDYVIAHAKSIVDAGDYYFDSASNEAVADVDVLLTDYEFVDWILGEESTVDETFSAAEQIVVKDFLDSANKKMLISGAEIGWDLDYRGSSQDKDFLHNYLGVSYFSDDSNVYSVYGSDLLTNIAVKFDDGTHGIYTVGYPDVFATSGANSVAQLKYQGTNEIAGILNNLASGSKVLTIGFPLETIYETTDRNAIFAKIFEQLHLSTTLLAINPTNLPDGKVKKLYSQQISVTGGSAPYLFTILTGNLPDGLQLDINTGLISGKPTQAGTFSFTVSVIDSNSLQNIKNYVIEIVKKSAAGYGCNQNGTGSTELTLIIVSILMILVGVFRKYLKTIDDVEKDN